MFNDFEEVNLDLFSHNNQKSPDYKNSIIDTFDKKFGKPVDLFYTYTNLD